MRIIHRISITVSAINVQCRMSWETFVSFAMDSSFRIDTSYLVYVILRVHHWFIYIYKFVCPMNILKPFLSEIFDYFWSRFSPKFSYKFIQHFRQKFSKFFEWLFIAFFGVNVSQIIGKFYFRLIIDSDKFIHIFQLIFFKFLGWLFTKFVGVNSSWKFG